MTREELQNHKGPVWVSGWASVRRIDQWEVGVTDCYINHPSGTTHCDIVFPTEAQAAADFLTAKQGRCRVMTQESLDILSKAPVGSSVEVEGRRVRVAKYGEDHRGCSSCCFNDGCSNISTPNCTPGCRADGLRVKFIDVTDQKSEPNPWQDWPDATREGWCQVPVVIARNIRTLIDETTPNQWRAAGLTGNDTIEATVFLDNAVNGGKGE